MGERAVRQEALFYGFNLDDCVPSDHLLRSIDRFVELTDIRRELAPYYSAIGRPSGRSTTTAFSTEPVDRRPSYLGQPADPDGRGNRAIMHLPWKPP